MDLNPAKENGLIDDDSQEGITVAIRMRPLNNVEENKRRTWKVLPKYSSIAQTTRDGKPLAERITGRTFFTFDKTFGEDTNNKQVYDCVAKGIVNSAVDGLNGTIFAYGQTSSGKTYTMQGAGNLEQGMGGEGGVVHMAANDIFSQITKKQERNFLVRVSFLEIYNEEVRDLLGDTNQTLQIREDPRRGVFVHSEEEIVTDFDELLKVLVHGDKSRTFASTGMNERSSRSHTILRITIESREKEYDEDSDHDYDMHVENRNPSSDGAIRISTLNLVDLAGSESVRHTGATGDRQKEGGLINQSLLTLSRVIVALGAPNQTHINFRDSKLTRILQPSLSGNARMAVICCATPSELYLEETRSTLQFASRAKLVKTNAQVNEVLDERSMIRRLQKELAEARRNQDGPGQGQVRDLEAKVATAGTQAMEAKKKLDRLKASILTSGYIIDQGPVLEADSLSKNIFDASKKRRKSDGPLLIGHTSPSKTSKPQINSPNTAPRRKKKKVLQHQTLNIKQELKLVQEALATRNIFVRDLNQTLKKCSEEIKKKNLDVEQMTTENTSLSEENRKSHANVTGLQEMVASLKESLDSSVRESEHALAEKDSSIMESFERFQQTLREKEDSRKDNDDLMTRLIEVEEEKSILEERISSLEQNSQKEKEDFETKLRDFESSIADVSKGKEEVEVALEDTNTRLNETSKKLQLQVSVTEEKESQIVAKEEEIKNLYQGRQTLDVACKEALAIIATLNEEKVSLETTVSSIQEEVIKTQEEKESNCTKLGESEEANGTLSEKLKEVEDELSNLRASNMLTMQDNETAMQSLQSQIAETEQKLEEERELLSKTQQENESSLKILESGLAENEQQLESEASLKSSLETTLSETQKLVEESQSSEETLKDALKTISDEKIQLENDLRQSNEAVEEMDHKLRTLVGEQEVAIAEKNSMEAVVVSHQQNTIEMERQMANAAEQILRVQSHYELISIEKETVSIALESMKQKLEETLSEMSALKSEREEASQKLQSIEGEHATKDSTVRQLEEQARIRNVEIQGLRNSLEAANVKFVEQEAAFTTLAEEKKALEDHLQEIEDINTAKISTLEQLHADKEQVTQELEDQLAQTKMKVQELQDGLNNTNSKLVGEEAEFAKLTEEKKALEDHLQEIEDINTAKVATLEQLHVDKEQATQELEDRLEQSKAQIKDLQNRLDTTNSSLVEQEAEFTKLTEEKKALEVNLQEIEDINTAKVATLEQLHVDKEQATQEFEGRLEQSKAQIEDLQNRLDNTNIKLVEQEAEFAKVTEEKKALDAHLQEIEDINTAKVTTLEHLHIDKDQATQELEGQLVQSKTELLELKKNIESTSFKLEEQEAAFTKLALEKDALQTTAQEMEDINAARESILNELHAAIREMEDMSAVKDLNLEKLYAEKEESTKELKQQVDDYNEKIKNLEKTLFNVEFGNLAKESVVDQVQGEKVILQEDLVTRNSQIEELEKDAIDMKNQNEGLSSNVEIQRNEIESLLLNLMQLTSEKQEFESSYVELKNSCESLAAENETMHTKISEIDEKNTGINLELEALKIEYTLMSGRNTTLEASEQVRAEVQVENENVLTQYEEEVTDLSEQINTVFIEATALKEQNNELQYTCENLKSELEDKNSEVLQLQVEVESMTTSREEMVRSIRDSKTERDEAKNEVENLMRSRETLTRSLRDREAERDEATFELKRLYDENRDLNESMNNSVPKMKEEQLREEISDLTTQNLELKHLLASVNESEERLRNAVKVAENNFMVKTTELEDAQYRISQIEQELSEFQTAGVEIIQIEKSKADLVEGIESVTKEKEDIEKLLREEREAKAKLQQQMGEEQRALIQEGENMMTDLRRKLEECEIKFKQSEADAYTARQHIEEINDERNRLDEKYLEASAQLNSSDSSKQRQEARITALESELNHAKSESYALKESIIDMKEKMRRSTRDSEKAMRESEIANSEVSTIRRKLSSLENVNETHQLENTKLKKKIKQSEENNTLVTMLQEELKNKESEIDAAERDISVLKLEIEKQSRSTRTTKTDSNGNDIQIMKNELEKMNKLMIQKDKRIKKLEAVRLTKDRLAHISKMKADNENFEKKCSKMEKEINRLQDKISSLGSEADMKSEISDLRFDKEALERKLRKFATHCQRLEDDKAGITDALGSCNIDVEAHGSVISEAIIHLCDKFMSIEEALEKQQSNPSFEKEKQSMQRKIQNLSHSENELIEKLNQYQREKSDLEIQLENAKKEISNGESEEHREKLRFLEHENLQLMQDVKSTKRQLQTAREEVETLRMNVDQSPTSDFGGLDIRTSTKDTIHSLTTYAKENSDTMELTNLAKACSKDDTDDVMRRSTRLTKKRTVLADNTNGTRNEERRKRSINKRQKVNALFETKHAMNPTGVPGLREPSSIGTENMKQEMNRSGTPRLGETSSLDTENTGECKQS